VSFFYFNLEDPLVGGYTPEKLALRRAISMGFDRKARIAQVLNGQAIPASQPVPPALYGHDPKYAARYGFDPAAARALLERFGYKDRDGDGYRELPDGKPLVVEKASTPNATDRTSDELWKKSMDAIGVRIEDKAGVGAAFFHLAQDAGDVLSGRLRRMNEVTVGEAAQHFDLTAQRPEEPFAERAASAAIGIE